MEGSGRPRPKSFSVSFVSNSPQFVASPCAACKVLRRRCTENCVLAPYFPPNDPYKFAIAHRIFGASNVIKLLQELPETHRADAVTSLVYEANARVTDPIYGCTGLICQLHKQVDELQAQLAKAQAEIVTVQCQYSTLMAISMGVNQSPAQSFPHQQQPLHYHPTTDLRFLDDNNPEPLLLDSLWM